MATQQWPMTEDDLLELLQAVDGGKKPEAVLADYTGRRRVWAVVDLAPGQAPFEIRDLHVGVIDQIATHAKTLWSVVVDGPTMNLTVMQLLLARVAEHLDIPPIPANELTARRLDLHFRLVPDTVPEPPPVEDQDPPTGGGETSTVG